ncbi:MAG: M56 family metallopeptidase [Solirubrobacterales bacterium]|nr:M56 family metallopeptidase [Solirubrobacterales bacterium]
MSTVAILAPLSVAACFGLLGPHLARRLPPRDATWLISIGAVVSALSAVAVLGLLGTVLLGQLPDLASLGHWSSSTLRRRSPIEPGIGALSLLAVLVSGVAAAFVGARRALAVLAAYRACGGIAAEGDLVVIDGTQPSAVAVPGRPGRIVVSRSLLRLLSPGERRVLLAHERAHLSAGHHWHRSAVALAIAANPLLTPLSGAITYATERWADERAAADLGDRRGTARALARVALLTGRSARQGEPRLAIGRQAVSARVSALLSDAPTPQPMLALATIALLTLGLLATLMVEKEIEHLFELAGHVYRTAATRGGAG